MTFDDQTHISVSFQMKNIGEHLLIRSLDFYHNFLRSLRIFS